MTPEDDKDRRIAALEQQVSALFACIADRNVTIRELGEGVGYWREAARIAQEKLDAQTGEALKLKPLAGQQQTTSVPVSPAMQPVVGASTVANALQLISTPVFVDFGAPAFGASTSGAMNGIIGQVTNDLPPNAPDFPTGVTGYGDMRSDGSYVFGVFGRADLFVAGTAVGAEFDSFNWAAVPTGQLPPSNQIGTSDACAIALQVAAFGNYPSLVGFAVLDGSQPFQYGIYTHAAACSAYSVFIDASPTKGPTNAAALIRSKAEVPNLLLQSQGASVGFNAVFAVIDEVGGVHASINQQGDYVTPGIVVGHDGTIDYLTPALASSASLPEKPLGFLVQKLNGVSIKIPYYEV